MSAIPSSSAGATGAQLRGLAVAVALGAALAAALLFLMAPNRVQAQQPDGALAADLPTIVRVEIASDDEIARLAAGYDVWEVHRAEGYVVIATDPSGMRQLQTDGFTVTVDTGATARTAAAIQQIQFAPASPVGGIPGYACYRTVEETYVGLQALAAAHPKLARWVDIGDSWDKITPGGNPGYNLYALELTNRESSGPKFPFVVMAAIHARELTTSETATRFAERLLAAYGTDADATWLLDYGAVYVIPFANPDGRKLAEQGLLWRKNTHNDGQCGVEGGRFSTYGIDLNRNSSFQWNGCFLSGTGLGCSSDNSCSVTYRGESPASEPETEAIEEYLSTLFVDQRGPAITDTAPATTTGVFISLHSYSELILWPWGWTEDEAPNSSHLKQLGSKFARSTGYAGGQAPDMLYMTDGTTDDWAYGELGVAAYTFELGNYFFESCLEFENHILTSTLEALHYGLLSARRPYQTPSGPDIRAVTTTAGLVGGGSPFTLSVAFGPWNTPYDATQRELADSPVATATWWLDTPPWLAELEGSEVTSGTLEAADGVFDEADERAVARIDPSSWAFGRHVLYVQGVDGAGAQGMVRATSLYVVVGHTVRLPWITSDSIAP